MSIEQGSEEHGRKILDIYKHFDSKPGQILTSNNFLAIGMDRRWASKDLKSGLDFAVDKGWLEKLPTGQVKLTTSGYERM